MPSEGIYQLLFDYSIAEQRNVPNLPIENQVNALFEHYDPEAADVLLEDLLYGDLLDDSSPLGPQSQALFLQTLRRSLGTRYLEAEDYNQIGEVVERYSSDPQALGLLAALAQDPEPEGERDSLAPLAPIFLDNLTNLSPQERISIASF